jgi:hypothetical protein
MKYVYSGWPQWLAKLAAAEHDHGRMKSPLDRFRVDADMKRQAKPVESVENAPTRTLVARDDSCRIDFQRLREGRFEPISI